MSGSAGVAITTATAGGATATEDIDKKCCECLPGFSPVYVDGQTTGCNIQRCSRNNVVLDGNAAYDRC